MAPREIPPARRQHREILQILKNGVFASEDPEGQINVFREFQKYGKMPYGFESPKELEAHAQSLLEAGFSIKDIRTELGVDSIS